MAQRKSRMMDKQVIPRVDMLTSSSEQARALNTCLRQLYEFKCAIQNGRKKIEIDYEHFPPFMNGLHSPSEIIEIIMVHHYKMNRDPNLRPLYNDVPSMDSQLFHALLSNASLLRPNMTPEEIHYEAYFGYTITALKMDIKDAMEEVETYFSNNLNPGFQNGVSDMEVENIKQLGALTINAFNSYVSKFVNPKVPPSRGFLLIENPYQNYRSMGLKFFGNSVNESINQHVSKIIGECC